MATPETKSQNTSGSNSLPNNLNVAATTGVKSCSKNSASQEVAADEASATSQKLKLTWAAPTQPQQLPTATAEDAITASEGAWTVKFAAAADPPKQAMKQSPQMQKVIGQLKKLCQGQLVPPKASSESMEDLTAQTGHANEGDWEEQVYQKMLAPREQQRELLRTFQQLLQQHQLLLQWQQQLTMSGSQGNNILPQQIQNIPPMIMQQLQQNQLLQLWRQQQQQIQLLQQWQWQQQQQQQNQSLQQWRKQQQPNQSLHQWRVQQQQQNQSPQQWPKHQQQNQLLRMQQQQNQSLEQWRMQQQQNQSLQQQKHMLLNPKYELEGVPQPQPEQSSKQEQVVVQMPSATQPSLTQPLLAKPANSLPHEDATKTARGRSVVKLGKLMKLPVLGLRKKVALLIVVLTLLAVLSMALMGFPSF